MSRYEYKVVAAPRKAKAFKGVRSHEDQFACVLAEVMNRMAAEKWEYLRAESLPCEEKTGLTSRVESYQSVLIFRRELVADQQFFEVPPTHQIELHEIREDQTEHEVMFTSSQRPASASLAPVPQEQTEASEEPASQAGVLDILRNRKARLVQDSGEDYPEYMRQAAE